MKALLENCLCLRCEVSASSAADTGGPGGSRLLEHSSEAGSTGSTGGYVVWSDQWTKPWWAHAFQCLQLLHFPSSRQFVSLSPIARTQRPLFGKAARPSASSCFWFQSNILPAIAFHQVTLALSISAGCGAQALLGSAGIQHCWTAGPPCSAPQQISLDVAPHLLAQTHPLELLSTTQLEGCQQQGHHSSGSF